MNDAVAYRSCLLCADGDNIAGTGLETCCWLKIRGYSSAAKFPD